MIKKAVIVAAGLSGRLYPLTSHTPKALLEVNGQTILMRNIQLLQTYGVEDITIVVGFYKEKIIEVVGDKASFIFNPFYKFCNNMGSLWFAKKDVNDEPFLYLHGDIIYTEKLLENFVRESNAGHSGIDLAVDFKETDEEAMKVKVNENRELIESNKEIPIAESDGEWIGLAAVHQPKQLFTYIETALTNEHYNVYDTFAFTNMVTDGLQIKCLSTYDENWMEIDFLEDYEKAKELF